MSSDIFEPGYIPPMLPKDNKFKFNRGDAVEFDRSRFHIYEHTENYVTIHVLKKLVTAKLMEFMETRYDAIYHGPMIDWDGSMVHVTFKRKV